MATATKSARLKNKKVISQTEPEEPGHDGEVVPAKIKKPIEIDEPEAAVGIIDEKIEDDPLVGAVEDEDGVEEASLDGEELNPFGDRWEE